LPAQLFDCLHGGVAQSIAALAMNLHLVSQSHDVPDSANARQLLVSSITLVEQCSREVRSLTRLLRPGSPLSTSSCA
jgi:signal transduction histidine kinase